MKRIVFCIKYGWIILQYYLRALGFGQDYAESRLKEIIMKEHCIDLELAKELDEKGFPKTIYCWYRCYANNKLKWFCGLYDEDDKVNKQLFAPNSDELLKELPKWTGVEKAPLGWFVSNDIELPGENFIDKKLSNALAHLWLDLKKAGHIK